MPCAPRPMLFYTPDIQGILHSFDETESKHMIRVLRLVRGDRIHLADGKGNLYEAILADPDPRKCRVEIVSRQNEYGKRNHYIHIAVAPTKNTDRLEWFAEKATEIGIDEITPVLCERSERKVLKTDRLERVMIAAMKQSGRAYLPRINALIPLDQLLTAPFPGRKFIAHCHDQDKSPLSRQLSDSRSNLVLIGPEGDFSEQELGKALREAFIPVALGKSTLRTETAALVACHTINLLCEQYP